VGRLFFTPLGGIAPALRGGAMSIRWGLSTVLAAWLVAGCGDDCDHDHERCDGQRVMTCLAPSCRDLGCVLAGRPTEWSLVEECPAACVQPDGGPPFCAESDEPDPSCIGKGGSHCRRDTVVRCRDGFAVEHVDCGDAGQSCVRGAFGGPICWDDEVGSSDSPSNPGQCLQCSS
jgi:hypothetical protein